MVTHYRRHRKNEIKRLRRKAARQRNVLEKLGAVIITKKNEHV